MNLRLSPRDCAARVRLELIAISFVTLLIGAACFLTLSFEDEKFHTSGHELDLRLLAVRPDASDDLYDVAGRPSGTRAFDGRNTNAWGSNMLRRDFLLSLPEGVVIQPVSYQVWHSRQYVAASEFLATNQFTTGATYTVEASFPDFYWHSGFFFGGQRPVDFVDVHLSFFLPERGPAAMRFAGPFVAGVTNKAQSATQQWWKCELILNGAAARGGVTNSSFQFFNIQGWQNYGSLTFLDRAGRRHFFHATNYTQTGGQWITHGEVRGVAPEQITAAEIHLPQEKIFHHVKVRYPERPVLTGPAPRGGK